MKLTLLVLIDVLNFSPQLIDFLMPESPRDKGENPIVDSLAVASEWTIVSKCALHGLIDVWDLKATLKTGEHNLKKNSDKVTNFAAFKNSIIVVWNLDCLMYSSRFWKSP